MNLLIIYFMSCNKNFKFKSTKLIKDNNLRMFLSEYDGSYFVAISLDEDEAIKKWLKMTIWYDLDNKKILKFTEDKLRSNIEEINDEFAFSVGR